MTYPTGGFEQQYPQPGFGQQYQQPQQAYHYPYPAPPPTGYGPPTNIAGMGARLGARLIDGVLLALVFALIIGIVLGIMGLLGTFEPGASDGLIITFAILITLLSYVFPPLAFAAYEVLFIGLSGATLGKRILGIKVVNQHTQQPIGIGHSLLRWVIPFGMNIVCLGWLAYLSPLFDNSGRNQGWHDKAAEDLVIKT